MREANGNIFLDGEPGEQREVLKDEGGGRVEPGLRPATKSNLAGSGLFEADDDAKQRGLAASGGPEDGNDFVARESGD